MSDEHNDKPHGPMPIPAAQPAPMPPRRLVRRPEGKILGGVCTGVAAYTGTDPVLVRVGFVLAAILGGGTGVLIYLVMWLVMPMAHEGEPYPPPTTGSWFDSSSTGRWIGIGAIVIGALFIFHNIWHVHAGLFWGLILLGVGVALWSRELSARNGHTSSPLPPSPPKPQTLPLQGIGGGAPPIPPPPTMQAMPVAPAPSPPVRAPSSVLGRLVVGAAALAIGIAVLADNLGILHATPRGVAAVVLGIVGLGLVIGAWVGRARWLIFPGMGLVLVLGGLSVVPTNIRGGWGDIVWQPQAWSDVRGSYEHSGGDAVLNLTRLEFGKEPRTVNVSQAFGNLEVLVPPDVPVFVQARVQGGNMTLFGHENNGYDVRDSITEAGKPDIGKLTLKVRVGFGNITVRRGTANEDVPAPRHGRRVNVQVGPTGVNVDTTGGSP